MTRLSHLPGERALQRYVLAFVGWLLLALAAFVVAVLLVDEPPVALRAAFGAGATAVAVRLPLLLRRHTDELVRTSGLKGQYVTAGFVTAVLPVPGALFLWWTGLGASAIGVLTVLLAARVRTVPAERMTQQIDYRDPEAWQDLAGRSTGRPFAMALVAGLVLAVAIVGIAFVAVG